MVSPWGEAVPLQALFEAGFGGMAQRLRLVHLARAALGGEPRQDRRQRHRAEGAALGNLDGGGERLRQVGEQLRHFGAALEAVLGGELAALGIGDQLAFCDAQQRIVGFMILARGKERLVGGDQGNAAAIAELDQNRLDRALDRHAVALQFDIEPVAEPALQFLAARQRQRVLAAGDGDVERPARAAGERDQSVGLAVEPGKLDVRALVRRGFEIARDDSRIRLR